MARNPATRRRQKDARGDRGRTPPAPAAPHTIQDEIEALGAGEVFTGGEIIYPLPPSDAPATMFGVWDLPLPDGTPRLIVPREIELSAAWAGIKQWGCERFGHPSFAADTWRAAVAWSEQHGLPEDKWRAMTAEQFLQSLRAETQSAGPAPANPPDGSAFVPASKSDRSISCSDLAKKHGINNDVLRKRLARWRMKHDAGYAEVSTRTPHDPKFVYDESAVMPIIQAIENGRPTGV